MDHIQPGICVLDALMHVSYPTTAAIITAALFGSYAATIAALIDFIVVSFELI